MNIKKRAVLALSVLAVSGLASITNSTMPRAQAANGPLRDYFSDTFGDPLDYSNTEDVALVTEGPIQGVISEPTLSGGQMHLDFDAPGYFSPAWAGYDAGGSTRGSAATPHDREVGNHPIDPAKYSLARFRMNASEEINASANFYTCPHGVNATCETPNAFIAKAGWHTYEFSLPSGTPVTGFRVAVLPQGIRPLHVDVDWAQIVGSGPGNAEEDGTVNGPVPEVLNPDIAGAVQYLFPLGGRQVPYSGRTCKNNDWATNVINDGWDYTTRTDIVEAGQFKPGWTITGGIFAGQWDSATFAPIANPADIFHKLNMGRNVIDTNTFHLATALLEKYDGRYSQKFAPRTDSGFAARFVTKINPADKRFQQFNPITEYPNDTTLSVDLKDPAPYDGIVAAPTDSTEKIPGQVGWVGKHAVFRFDPAEPYNERFIYVDEVLLSTDDCGLTDFDIEFAENNNTGGTAELSYSASPLGPWTSITTVAAAPGRNTYKWTAPAGLWWIKIGITGANGTFGENVSTGPVRIGTEFKREIAANQAAGKGKPKK
jgi:hypothetical protein